MCLFKDLDRFIRNLTVKRFYAKDQIDSSKPITSGEVATNIGSTEELIQQDVLATLMELWDDGLPHSIPCDNYGIPEVAHTGFKPKSTFFPSAFKGPYVETYYQATYRDLLNLCNTKSSSPPNLSSAERTAISTLKNNNLLVIKQADKGGSLVIQDRTDYEKEAQRLLSDQKTYAVLRGDPLPGFQVELKSLVEEAANDGVLCKREKQFLCPTYAAPPTFTICQRFTSPPYVFQADRS